MQYCDSAIVGIHTLPANFILAFVFYYLSLFVHLVYSLPRTEGQTSSGSLSDVFFMTRSQVFKSSTKIGVGEQWFSKNFYSY